MCLKKIIVRVSVLDVSLKVSTFETSEPGGNIHVIRVDRY